ncbi:copper chaperone PCu(A)C [bacterium]|nr:copper chaperone PCu(A)C [bacterium]
MPARGEVAFQPGGLHVMLFDQTAPKAGDAVPVTLTCDDGSTVTFAATAQAQAPKTTSNASPTASTNATTTTR